MKVDEEEDVVTGLDIDDIFNSMARTGVSPYFFLDRAGPSAPPPARVGPLAPPLAVPPTSTQGIATTPPTIRRLLCRRVATVDRRPGIHRGTWNPALLGLPSAEVLNMASGGSGFYSPDEGESSSN